MENQTQTQNQNQTDGKPQHDDSHKPTHDMHEEIPKDLPKISSGAVMIAGIVIVVAFIALFLLAWIPSHRREAKVNEESEQANNAKPSVQVQQPKRTDKKFDVILPADLRANQETSIFPRASGYLQQLMVDIGDHVEVGQLLAVISVPDLDAQLAEAQATVVQANANLVKAQNDYELSDTTLKRYQGLAQSGGVTQQQLDEKTNAFTQAQSELAGARAAVKVDEAAVQRLAALQGFEKVTAPFSGTITGRNYDVGALISATNTTPGAELFRIADTSVLRVFVNVPQPYVAAIKTGQAAYISVTNFPGREFTGAVARTAGALDMNTRTLRYEIDYQNKDNTLYAGMYGQARLQINQTNSPLVIPTSALIFDSGGTKVWTVDQGKAQSKKVQVGRDFGTQVEISSGLDGTESVVTNPGLWLADGAEVQVIDNNQSQPQPQKQPVADDNNSTTKPTAVALDVKENH
jgi:RND family efflux transporter MFP subunit